jgi:hypothetical protein
MKHYLIICEGMVEPSVISGPFEDNDALLEAAKETVKKGEFELEEYGEDALFWLDIDDDGSPAIGSFANGFMDEAREAT